MNNKISIITPFYNSSKYLKKTILSVINQTYKNWELILINDNSSDNSVLICMSMMKKNKKIKLINNVKNLGPALSRKKGLKYSSGDYICFLDSDDYWQKNKLYRQLKFMKKNYLSMSFTECYHYKDNLLYRNFKIPEEVNYEKLLKHNYVITSSTMIKSEVIKLHDIKDVGYDDYNLWLNLCKKGYNFFYLNKKLSTYRHVEKSVSSNKFRALYWVFNIYFRAQKKNIILSIFYTLINGITAIYKKTKYHNV